MAGWRTFPHEFTESDVCAHCCAPNLNGCEAKLTPQEWFSYQVWNTGALDRFKVNLKKTHGGANNLNVCEHVQCDHPKMGCGWLQGGQTKVQLRCASCEDLKHLVDSDPTGGSSRSHGSLVGCGNNLREAPVTRTQQFAQFFETKELR